MNRYTAAYCALFVLLAAGCGSAAPTATPTVAPTGTTVDPTATPNFPDAVPLEPAAIIDMAGITGVIALTSDGTTVWAAGDGEILRIDAQTNAVQRLPAPVQPDDTTLAIASDGLWATRWGGGRVYRLDPQTGAVLLEVEMPKAVRIAFIGDALWVGREDDGSMSVVDRESGEIGPSVPQGAYGVAGEGDLWFAFGSLLKIVRVDPITGDEKATFEFPGETNCGISGSFPENAWTTCFGRELMSRSAAHIDPGTNTISALVTLPPTHGGTVIDIAGQPWFVGTFEDAEGEPFAGLARLIPETQTVDRLFALAGADPNTPVVAADALWVPDEAGHRILRVDLADLL